MKETLRLFSLRAPTTERLLYKQIINKLYLNNVHISCLLLVKQTNKLTYRPENVSQQTSKLMRSRTESGSEAEIQSWFFGKHENL